MENIISELDLLEYTFFQEHLEAIKNREEAAKPKVSESIPIRLTTLETSLVQSILSSCIDQLQIINKTNRTGSGATVKTEISQSQQRMNVSSREALKIRFNERIRKQVFFQPAVQMMKDAMLDMIEMKMSRDVEYVKKALSETLEDVRAGRETFAALQRTIDEDLEDERSEYLLLMEYIKNKKYLGYLKNKLKHNSKAGEKMTRELDEKVADLENEIYNLKIENSIKTRLVEKWEGTRFEQEKLILSDEERKLTNIRDVTQEKINIEQRAINDIECYIQHKIETIDGMTAQWMEKYEKEVEQLDENIQVTRERINELKLKNESMSAIYEKRKVEMNEYWKKKRVEREALELEERKWRSAVRLQAWWRGTMVRKGFGRFRKKKGKAGRKK